MSNTNNNQSATLADCGINDAKLDALAATLEEGDREKERKLRDRLKAIYPGFRKSTFEMGELLASYRPLYPRGRWASFCAVIKVPLRSASRYIRAWEKAAKLSEPERRRLGKKNRRQPRPSGPPLLTTISIADEGTTQFHITDDDTIEHLGGMVEEMVLGLKLAIRARAAWAITERVSKFLPQPLQKPKVA